MENMEKSQSMEASDGFKFPGKLKDCRPFGSGHINDTYLLTFEVGDAQHHPGKGWKAIFCRFEGGILEILQIYHRCEMLRSGGKAGGFL